MRSRTALASGVAATMVVAVPATAQQATMVVIPFEEARFVPLDATPDATSIAVLSGDPAVGPSSMLMRMSRGIGRLHVHTSDYRLVVLSGQMKHRSRDQPEDEAPRLGPGSFWAQPGSVAHADSCLSESCTMYIQWSGPRDTRAAD
jgi:hypothetical protein